MFQQLMEAIQALHAQNLVHRDLKPENILIDGSGNLRLADFGLASGYKKGSRALKTSCGSPYYAAPEITLGHSYEGPEVDVWSAGAILYSLLCGGVAFYADTVPRVFRKIQ